MYLTVNICYSEQQLCHTKLDDDGALSHLGCRATSKSKNIKLQEYWRRRELCIAAIRFAW
jgi:hypothetical protein